MDFPGGANGKESTCNADVSDVGSITKSDDPLQEAMTAHSIILAWRIPGQRSLVGYSPWGRKESDMTEAT